MCLFWDWGSFDFLVHKIIFLMNNDNIQNEKNPIGPNSIKTTNAGLGHTADILEEVFTNAEFPATAASLGTSLQQGGKSRECCAVLHRFHNRLYNHGEGPY